MRTLSGPLYPHAITALCAALLFAACGGGDLSLPPEGQPATVTILDGNEQSGRVGEPLALPLLIQVSDSRGEPVAGATVAFEFSSAGPGAAVVPEQKTTNSAGQADAQLVLGTTVGRQAGQVRVVAPAPTGEEPVQASFSAMALSENANSMAAAGGQDQTGHVLQPLDDRLVVEVTDGFGNPVAGVPITWATAGGGTVSADIVPTDEDGRSRVERILGPTVGQQTTLATSEGLAGSPVVFVHTAIAGDASRLTIVSGDDQTGALGTLLPAELVVRLIDSEGNGVPNTAVTWVPAIGGGAPNPLNTTTDNDGRTSTQWTLGPALGDQRMDAVVSGVGVASFTATATAGAPASLFISTQPSSGARNGIPFDRQPVVQLRDPQGNDVATAGVQVTVSLNGGGELEGTTRRTTDASGRATFTDLAISGTPGTRTLVFEAVGFAPVTSSVIAVSAIGTTTTITGDLPDPSQVGTPFTVSFRVASEGPTPSGNVTVSDGVQSCAGALSNGAGSCQLSLSTAGERTLTATYAGSPGLTGSSDTEVHTVTAAPPPPPAGTTTTITSDLPDPSISGGAVTVAVRVTSVAGTPTGNVTISVSGANATCTIALSGGEGSCSMILDGVGGRTFTATYQGGPGFAGSSGTEDHLVTAAEPPPPPPPASTTTIITEDSPDPSINGASVTVRFQVSSAGGTPTGSVTVTSSTGSGSCTGNLIGGSGSCEVPLNGVGDRTLTASYSGAPGFLPSSDTEPHTVTAAPPPPPASTTTTITADSPDPSVSGSSVNVAFQVASSGGTPTGSVTVSDGVASCSDDLSGGSGSCELTLSTIGERTLTATYSGVEGFEQSSDTEPHTVTAPPPAATTTRFEVDNPDPTNPGESFTVTLSVGSSAGTPEGSATVSDGVDSCSIQIVAGSGSCSLALSTPGDRTLTATYEGNSSFASSSAQETHTVNTPNQQPAAAFEFDCNDLECDFRSTSSDSDGRIVNYLWAFGDGETSGDGDDDQPEHIYDTPGTYQVTLTVTDDDGATGSITQPVEVSQTAVNQAPVANIGSISCAGLTCSFTDASIDADGDDTIAEWSWIFGDGESSTERNPVHAYSAPDQYDVQLRVTDDRGLSSTDSEGVTVAVEDGAAGGG